MAMRLRGIRAAAAMATVCSGLLLLPSGASAQSSNGFANASNAFAGANNSQNIQNIGTNVPDTGAGSFTSAGVDALGTSLPQFFTGSTVVPPGGADLPSEEKDRRAALRALPTKKPPVTYQGLTVIPLSIDGQDCGVLGAAGAVDGTNNACGKSPINLSGLTDGLP